MTKAEILDGLYMLRFFNDRAGRLLWFDKTTELQDKDIKRAEKIFSEAIEFIENDKIKAILDEWKNTEHPELTKVEYFDKIIDFMNGIKGEDNGECNKNSRVHSINFIMRSNSNINCIKFCLSMGRIFILLFTIIICCHSFWHICSTDECGIGKEQGRW